MVFVRVNLIENNTSSRFLSFNPIKTGCIKSIKRNKQQNLRDFNRGLA